MRILTVWTLLLVGAALATSLATGAATKAHAAECYPATVAESLGEDWKTLTMVSAMADSPSGHWLLLKWELNDPGNPADAREYAQLLTFFKANSLREGRYGLCELTPEETATTAQAGECFTQAGEQPFYLCRLGGPHTS